jgi:hypothetical protein
VFVGHPYTDAATPSAFFEHRHALTAVPSGRREARRVFGAAPTEPETVPCLASRSGGETVTLRERQDTSYGSHP